MKIIKGTIFYLQAFIEILIKNNLDLFCDIRSIPRMDKLMRIFYLLFFEMLVLACSKTYFYFELLRDGVITTQGGFLLGLTFFITIFLGWLSYVVSQDNSTRSTKEVILHVFSSRIIRKILWILGIALAVGIFLYCLKIVVPVHLLDDHLDTLVTFLVGCIQLILYLEYHGSSSFREKIDSLPHFLKATGSRVLKVSLFQFFLFQLLLNSKIRIMYTYELILLVIISIAFQLYFLIRGTNLISNKIFKNGGKAGTKPEIFWILLIFITYSALKIFFIAPNSYLMMAPTDGHQYWQMANLIFQGVPDIRAYHHYPPLYSLVISPAFLFPKADTLKVISIINAIISSSAIFPIYLLARKFLSGSLPILFAAVSLAHPDHFLFPSHPASENLYYPLLFWTLYLITTSPRKNNFAPLFNAITGISIGLCYLTRYQTFPLVPLFFVIWWLKPQPSSIARLDWFPTKQKFVQFVIVVLFFITTYSLWLVPGLLQGVSIRDLLGFTVEGKQSLLSFDRPASSLILWGAITLGHVVLITAPLISTLLTVLRKIKSISLEPKMVHWLIAFGLISGMLYVIVVRHAWLAVYNIEEPTRLVTRYFIYFAVPAWLTIIALAKYINRKDLVPFAIWTVISICLVYVSFELFFNQEWILSRRILYIDAYLPYYAQKVFIATVAAGSLITIFLIWKNKTIQIPLVLVLCVLYINLASLPLYRTYFMDYQRGGRFLNEYLTQGILSENVLPVQGTKISLKTVETITHMEMQLTVRGLDQSNFETSMRTDLSDYPENTMMVLETKPGVEYLIVKSTEKIEGYETISEFAYSGVNYILVKEIKNPATAYNGEAENVNGKTQMDQIVFVGTGYEESIISGYRLMNVQHQTFGKSHLSVSTPSHTPIGSLPLLEKSLPSPY